MTRTARAVLRSTSRPVLRQCRPNLSLLPSKNQSQRRSLRGDWVAGGIVPVQIVSAKCEIPKLGVGTKPHHATGAVMPVTLRDDEKPLATFAALVRWVTPIDGALSTDPVFVGQSIVTFTDQRVIGVMDDGPSRFGNAHVSTGGTGEVLAFAMPRSAFDEIELYRGGRKNEVRQVVLCWGASALAIDPMARIFEDALSERAIGNELADFVTDWIPKQTKSGEQADPAPDQPSASESHQLTVTTDETDAMEASTTEESEATEMADFCTSCGAALNGGNFCTECGAAVAVAAPPPATPATSWFGNRCASCGAARMGTKCCTSCGAAADTAGSSAASRPAAASPPPSIAPRVITPDASPTGARRVASPPGGSPSTTPASGYETPKSAEAPRPAAPRSMEPKTVEPPANAPPSSEIDDKTRITTRGPKRKTEWKLVSSDGVVIDILGTIVVGRAPSADLVPEATAVPIEDEELSMSKSHASLTVTDKGLFVEDLDSTNGVHIVREGEDVAVGARTPTLVQAGETLLLGDREFTVETKAV